MQRCKLESQETNEIIIYILVHMKMLNPHPALHATSKSLEILLPVHAAVDLLFHINETEQASLTRIWNDKMENGIAIVNVCNCS